MGESWEHSMSFAQSVIPGRARLAILGGLLALPLLAACAYDGGYYDPYAYGAYGYGGYGRGYGYYGNPCWPYGCGDRHHHRRHHHRGWGDGDDDNHHSGGGGAPGGGTPGGGTPDAGTPSEPSHYVNDLRNRSPKMPMARSQSGTPVWIPQQRDSKN
jgi:hypothetical protein